MEVKWFIDNYEPDETLFPLIYEIKKQGMDCFVLEYHPFRMDGYHPVETSVYDKYNDDMCVVFYGRLNIGRDIQSKKGWVPGVYCDFNNLCCLTYFSHWSKYLLNEDYIMLPILEILRQRDYVFDKFGINNEIFIRPNSGSKTFTGYVVSKDKLDKEFEILSTHTAKEMDRILCIISSPKKIDTEWRYVVVDEKVVACSQYVKDGEINIKEGGDHEAEELANKIAKEEWQPDKAYTLDICKSNGQYHLLEANSFSCSSLYACDVVPIVENVSRIALKEWDEYNNV